VDSLGSRRLILDLRGNGGGNSYLNQPLVHALIRHPSLDRPRGLFVIVDRGTFSAAVSLSADLERETHAVFVGEPTGGAPNSPGDPTSVRLPASGLVARVSTVFWQGSDPRDPRAFIAPDVPAMPTWADWLAYRDPALAAIEAYRPAPGDRNVPPNMHWGSRAKIFAKTPAIAW
jgi:C-terminal processing protease CtpA/Prc